MTVKTFTENVAKAIEQETREAVVAYQKTRELQHREFNTPEGLVEILVSPVLRDTGSRGTLSNTLSVTYKLNEKRIGKIKLLAQFA